MTNSKPHNARALVSLFIVFTFAGISFPAVTFGEIVQLGDLNIISQDGNASDGLRFLDNVTGESMVAALIRAQASYADARFATPAEFNDLFAASTLSYDGSLKLSDGFLTGPDEVVSSGANFNSSLVAILGATAGTSMYLWTDPDGINGGGTTREQIFFNVDGGSVTLQNSAGTGTDSFTSWVLVSEAVPEPTSFAMFGIAMLGVSRRRRLKLK